MSERTSILVVDDSYQLRQSVKAMLQFESEFLVVGEAEDGEQAVAQALALKPDIVLMDVNMPRLTGIEATRRIMEAYPTEIVIISVQGEQGYLRQAMRAGARDYLIKPFTVDDLVQSLHQARERTAVRPPAESQAHRDAGGKLITVFSSKGGVGKTTLAANLATALALKTRLKVAAVDLDLEFGCLSAHLGTRPAATLLDLCRVDGPIEMTHVARVLTRATAVPVDVLAAPPEPHQASEVDGDGRMERGRAYVAEVLDLLKLHYDFVVIDTAASFRETNLLAFDRSDHLFVVTVPEVPALVSTGKAIDVLLRRLEYPPEKVNLVLNRARPAAGLSLENIKESLGRPVAFSLPDDPSAALWAANAGHPFTLRRARSELAAAVGELARTVATGEGTPPVELPELGTRRRLFGII